MIACVNVEKCCVHSEEVHASLCFSKKINDFDSALVEIWEKSLATYFESEFMKYPVIVIKKQNYFASKVNE